MGSKHTWPQKHSSQTLPVSLKFLYVTSVEWASRITCFFTACMIVILLCIEKRGHICLVESCVMLLNQLAETLCKLHN